MTQSLFRYAKIEPDNDSCAEKGKWVNQEYFLQNKKAIKPGSIPSRKK